jgi:hypothetical protein
MNMDSLIFIFEKEKDSHIFNRSSSSNLPFLTLLKSGAFILNFILL